MDQGRVVEHRGCRLACSVRGEGPPVLLVQGVGVHGDGWRPQVEALAPRFRCLSFDNRGIGHSQRHSKLHAGLRIDGCTERR